MPDARWRRRPRPATGGAARPDRRLPSAPLAGDPDLLARPAPRPLRASRTGSRVVVPSGGRISMQVLDLEAVRAEQPDPARRARGGTRPSRPSGHSKRCMPNDGRSSRSLGRDVVLVGDAEHQQDAVGEEHEPPAGPQQSRRLGHPGVRDRPTGRRRTRRSPGRTRRRGRGPAPRCRAAAGSRRRARAGGAPPSRAAGRVVDADRASAAPGEPGRHVGGAAAELDRVKARDPIDQVELRLRDAPHAPRGVLGPAPLAGGDVAGREPIPVGPVAGDVVGQVVLIAHGREPTAPGGVPAASTRAPPATCPDLASFQHRGPSS